MSDRLKDLQRQRALAQEQLDWLDREIAREAGQGAPLAAKPIPVPRAPEPAAPPTAASAQAAADAEAILAQYKSDPGSLQKNIKRGCYLYFFVALGLLALGVLALYFLRRAA
ncbi:MAG: hypothetical protein WCR49_04040 [Opitutae bacterium]